MKITNERFYPHTDVSSTWGFRPAMGARAAGKPNRIFSPREKMDTQPHHPMRVQAVPSERGRLVVRGSTVSYTHLTLPTKA